MSFSGKKWSLAEPDWSLQRDLISQLPISSPVAQVLINRGISSVSEARLFLRNSLSDLSSPWIIPGIKEAVYRLRRALSGGEKIMVYGDYDVDGLTSTALMVSLLRRLNAEVSYYIPDRSEGYGLHRFALEQASTQGVSLIVTVDCGISAVEEVAWGKKMGLDFIITDHHEPGLDLPEEAILVNPKFMADGRNLGDLAGVGVAFKLAQAVEEESGLLPVGGILGGSYLDLVALGTIADVVPLTGENRILATHGLKLLFQTRRAGLRALLQATGLEGKLLTPNQVAFILAPRLNAAGRMDSALPALELLLTDSEQEGRELAHLLNVHNETRQLLEQQFLKDAVSLLEKEYDPEGENIVVLSSPLWHAGILGTVASKMVDIYGKPVILLAVEGEQARGSGRSIPGFNLYRALESCREMLIKAGGHEQAVGLTLETSQLGKFKEKINAYARPRLVQEVSQPTLMVDAEVLPGQLDENLMRELEALQPFGYSNPEPVLLCRQTGLLDCRVVGREGKHLKLKVLAETSQLEAIAFNFGHLTETAAALEQNTDLVFSIERNVWNGQEKMQLKIKDFRFPEEETPNSVKSGGYFSFSTVKAGRQDYFCLNGFQQFDLLLEIIRFNRQRGHKSLVVFPTKRIMALYYRFLVDCLQEYGLSCTRLDRERERLFPGEKIPIADIDVFLAPSEIIFSINSDQAFNADPDCRLVWLKFPGLDTPESVVPELMETAISLSFQRIKSPVNFDFQKFFLDFRNKLDHLEELAGKSNQLLVVYVNQKQRVLDLYHRLKKMMPGRGRKIWYSHSGLCASQRQQVLNAVHHQLAEIIVTNELLDLRISSETGKTQRLIFDVPFSLEEFYLKSRPGLSPLSVHLLWNQQDLKNNENILKTIFPGKSTIIPVLNKVKEMSCIEGKKPDRQKLIQALRISFPRYSRPALKHAFRIWKETEWEELESSGEFRQGEKEKSSFYFLKSLLNQEDDRITDFLLGGVQAD